LQLYLQFDGPQLQAQQALRGADLRATRKKCIERCAEMGLPITLAMTVTRENLPFLWDAIQFGLQWPNIRGVCFQPMFTSGRTPKARNASLHSNGSDSQLGSSSPLNTADIILAAVSQSQGKLRFEDFTPLPCGDPNCATIGYLLKVGGSIRSISDFINF